MAEIDPKTNRPNIYDQSIRRLFQFDSIGMIRWLMPGLLIDCRFIHWHDTRNWPFLGFADLICDLVANLPETRNGKPSPALVIEFMARAKSSIFDRALLYVIEAFLRLRHGKEFKGRYQTHVAIVNLTGLNLPFEIESGPPATQNQTDDHEGWSFRPSIRNL